MKLIRCDKYQYVKNCSTENAYAIKHNSRSNDMMFLSKKHVKMTKEESESTKNKFYFWFEIPGWLYEKLSDENKDMIKDFDEDATARIVEHDRLTDPRRNRWYNNRETCQRLKPFG